MNEPIKKVSELFSKFPTIGHRTAHRFAFYLTRQPKIVDELIAALQDLKNLRPCHFCFNPTGKESSLCSICSNPARNRQNLCIVEKETDVISLENFGRYHGLYFILGGSVSSLKAGDLPNLRIEELRQRLKNPSVFGLPNTAFAEVIIATNPTPEGVSAAFLIEKAVKETLPQCKITRLARGLPSGGELEYADEETLESAFEGRR